MEVSNQPKLKFHGVDFVNIKFNIFMEISIHCENFFDLNVVGIGNFEFDKEFDDLELKKTFINLNAPAIMFPYVRAFITTLSTNLGNVTGPLVIPTQFFQGDLPEISMEENEE